MSQNVCNSFEINISNIIFEKSIKPGTLSAGKSDTAVLTHRHINLSTYLTR